MNNHRSGPGSSFVRLLPLLILTAVAACRGGDTPGDPGLTLEVGISPTPPGVGPARLLITLTDSTGTDLADALIAVEGNMSHAGMVPILDTARMISPGNYLVENFEFTMAGDWILTLEAILPDGRATTLRMDTQVYSAPGESEHQGHGEGVST